MRNKVNDLQSFYYGAFLGLGLGILITIFATNYPSTKTPLLYTKKDLAEEIRSISVLSCIEGRVGTAIRYLDPKEPEIDCKAVGDKWQKVYGP